jgi:hypothetical protein
MGDLALEPAEVWKFMQDHTLKVAKKSCTLCRDSSRSGTFMSISGP